MANSLAVGVLDSASLSPADDLNRIDCLTLTSTSSKSSLPSTSFTPRKMLEENKLIGGNVLSVFAGCSGDDDEDDDNDHTDEDVANSRQKTRSQLSHSLPHTESYRQTSEQTNWSNRIISNWVKNRVNLLIRRAQHISIGPHQLNNANTRSFIS